MAASPRTPPILHPGAVLGGYAIEAVLGWGGMAVVYRATQISLDRPVALKVLNAKLSDDGAFRERFIREGRHVARLTHENIVPVHDLGNVDGHLYLAMQLVDGETLADRMREPGLSAEATARILRKIGDALGAAHAAGILHRDVKPQNILLAGDRPYLADFGIAQATDRSTFTATGNFLGTVHYASPEQILGERLSPASDVYSLAAVAYECLTGAAPFPKHSEAGVIHAHLAEPPPSLPGKLGVGGRELSATLLRALAKSPGERPATPAEFCRELSAGVARLRPAERTRVPAFPRPEAVEDDPGVGANSITTAPPLVPPDAPTTDLDGLRPPPVHGSHGGVGRAPTSEASAVASRRGVGTRLRALAPAAVLAAVAVALPLGALAATRGGSSRPLRSGSAIIDVPAGWAVGGTSDASFAGLSVHRMRLATKGAGRAATRIGIATLQTTASTTIPSGTQTARLISIDGRAGYAYGLPSADGVAGRIVVIPDGPQALAVTCHWRAVAGDDGRACDAALGSLHGVAGVPARVAVANDRTVAGAIATLARQRAAALPQAPAKRATRAAAVARDHRVAANRIAVVAAAQPWDADALTLVSRLRRVASAYEAVASAARRHSTKRDADATAFLTQADGFLVSSITDLARREPPRSDT